MDYWRFAQMMLNRGELDGQRIIKPETVALMTRNHVDEKLLPLTFNGVDRGDYMGYGFGLGYCINMDPVNTAAAGSRGDFAWGGMADTYCWVDPEKQLADRNLAAAIPAVATPRRQKGFSQRGLPRAERSITATLHWQQNICRENRPFHQHARLVKNRR
jgi:CubicO group peptidase (beta-lactamase class C family)